MKLVTTATFHIHPLVYLVGAPKVGTPNYRNLLVHLGQMDVDITRVRMLYLEDDPFGSEISVTSMNLAISNKHSKVISIGIDADNYLMDTNINEFFSLYNSDNEKELDSHLEMCHTYIYGT